LLSMGIIPESAHDCGDFLLELAGVPFPLRSIAPLYACAWG